MLPMRQCMRISARGVLEYIPGHASNLDLLGGWPGAGVEIDGEAMCYRDFREDCRKTFGRSGRNKRAERVYLNET